MATTTQLDTYAAGLIARTMRQQGFIGAVDVDRLRATRTGHLARVIATVGAHRVVYRATIKGSRVTVTRVTAPHRCTGFAGTGCVDTDCDRRVTA